MEISNGKRRLEIARNLLKLANDASVLDYIKAMPKGARDHLRNLVDWVEEYENYERTMGKRLL